MEAQDHPSEKEAAMEAQAHEEAVQNEHQVRKFAFTSLMLSWTCCLLLS